MDNFNIQRNKTIMEQLVYDLKYPVKHIKEDGQETISAQSKSNLSCWNRQYSGKLNRGLDPLT